MLTKKHLSIISEQQNKPPALKIQMTKKMTLWDAYEKMQKEAKGGKPLKCGCVPGYYLCPLARQLWDNASDICEEWERAWTDENWQRYQEAKRQYDKHVQADE